MIIFPAIDIQDGECVRLTKGDFATAERVADDAVETALAFKEAGAEWLHMVDLDGAKTAQMQNRDVFIRVARATEMKIQLGGGIRDEKTATYYLENGIERIILGSLAVRNPKLVAELVRMYGDRIVVGIDAENGMVKIDGWLGAGKVSFLSLAKQMAYIGVRHVVYTDISRDGTLSGPNLENLKLLQESVGMNIIASGGISNIGDIQALADLKLYGAICGKSLYRQTLDLKEAIEVGASSLPKETWDDIPETDDPATEPSKPVGLPKPQESTPQQRGPAAGRPRQERSRPSGQNDVPARQETPRTEGTQKAQQPPQGGKAPGNRGNNPKQGGQRPAGSSQKQGAPRTDSKPSANRQDNSQKQGAPKQNGPRPDGKGGKPANQQRNNSRRGGPRPNGTKQGGRPENGKSGQTAGNRPSGENRPAPGGKKPE